jgi:hypothetical protein
MDPAVAVGLAISRRDAAGFTSSPVRDVRGPYGHQGDGRGPELRAGAEASGIGSAGDRYRAGSGGATGQQWPVRRYAWPGLQLDAAEPAVIRLFGCSQWWVPESITASAPPRRWRVGVAATAEAVALAPGVAESPLINSALRRPTHIAVSTLLVDLVQHQHRDQRAADTI